MGRREPPHDFVQSISFWLTWKFLEVLGSFAFCYRFFIRPLFILRLPYIRAFFLRGTVQILFSSQKSRSFSTVEAFSTCCRFLLLSFTPHPLCLCTILPLWLFISRILRSRGFVCSIPFLLFLYARNANFVITLGGSAHFPYSYFYS